MRLWSPRPRGSPLLLCLLLSLSCPSLLLALYLSPGCVFFSFFFLLLITRSYPSSPHHFPSRRTSVFFISETCQRGPNISVHSGRRRRRRRAHARMRKMCKFRRGAHITLARARGGVSGSSPARQHIAYVKSHSPY